MSLLLRRIPCRTGTLFALKATAQATDQGGGVFELHASVMGGTAPRTYLWEILDGVGTIDDDEAKTTTLTTEDPDDFTVRVTVTDANGKTSTSTSTFSQDALSVTIDAIDDIDVDGVFPLSATVVGGIGSLSYLWELTAGTGTIENEDTLDEAVLTLTEEGAATVKLTVTDDNGDVVDTESFTYTTPVLDKEQTAFGVWDLTAEVPGDPETKTYLWERTAGDSSAVIDDAAAKDTFVTLTVEGEYTFRLTVTDATGTKQTSINVTHAALGVVITAIPDDDEDGVYTLVATVTGGFGDRTYLWELTAGSGVITDEDTLDDAELTVEDTDDYTIKLTVTDDTGTEDDTEDFSYTAAVPTGTVWDSQFKLNATYSNTDHTVVLAGTSPARVRVPQSTGIRYFEAYITADTGTQLVVGLINPTQITNYPGVAGELGIGWYAQSLLFKDASSEAIAPFVAGDKLSFLLNNITNKVSMWLNGVLALANIDMPGGNNSWFPAAALAGASTNSVTINCGDSPWEYPEIPEGAGATGFPTDPTLMVASGAVRVDANTTTATMDGRTVTMSYASGELTSGWSGVDAFNGDVIGTDYGYFVGNGATDIILDLGAQLDLIKLRVFTGYTLNGRMTSGTVYWSVDGVTWLGGTAYTTEAGSGSKGSFYYQDVAIGATARYLKVATNADGWPGGGGFHEWAVYRTP